MANISSALIADRTLDEMKAAIAALRQKYPDDHLLQHLSLLTDQVEGYVIWTGSTLVIDDGQSTQAVHLPGVAA